MRSSWRRLFLRHCCRRTGAGPLVRVRGEVQEAVVVQCPRWYCSCLCGPWPCEPHHGVAEHVSHSSSAANRVILLLGVLVTHASAAQQAKSPNQEAKPLTNADVAKLVKAGISDGVLVQVIKGSATDFDTSPSALVMLKQQGVSDSVIAAMTQAESNKKGSLRTEGTLEPARASTVSCLWGLDVDEQMFTNQQLRDTYGIQNGMGTNRFLMISQVEPGSPAAMAGLRPKDLVLVVMEPGGHAMTSVSLLLNSKAAFDAKKEPCKEQCLFQVVHASEAPHDGFILVGSPGQPIQLMNFNESFFYRDMMTGTNYMAMYVPPASLKATAVTVTSAPALFVGISPNKEIPVRSDESAKGSQPPDLATVRHLAEVGVPQYQSKLGVAYRNGNGVPQDDVQAATWFRKAAAQGLADGQYFLGMSYLQGRGVPQDTLEALRQLLAAAEQQFSPAQGVLGIMYARGSGVARDVVQAQTWCTIAKTNDFELCAQSHISLTLTADQQLEVDRRVNEWFKNHPRKK